MFSPCWGVITPHKYTNRLLFSGCRWIETWVTALFAPGQKTMERRGGTPGGAEYSAYLKASNNKSVRNNFVRIEKNYTGDAKTRPTKGGSNSIIVSTKHATEEGGTTAAHEDGHGFGLFGHTSEKAYFKGIPSIMTTIKTYVESQYTVAPLLGPSVPMINEKGEEIVFNQLDRRKRQVTQDDILKLPINLEQHSVGKADNKIFKADGSPR